MKTEKPNIHKGHRQRLRDRYFEQGADGFRDHELLELLLGYSIPQKDTNPLGHALIERFGDLRGVLNAEPAELMKIEGIAETSACLLKLISGLTRRYFVQLADQNDKLTETKQQMEFFVPRFIGRQNECLYAAFLDQNDRLIKCELQFEGSIDAVEIHNGRIANNALLLRAAKVVIAHNHFSNATPSDPDVAATNLLRDSLYLYGIVLVDHIVVCGANAVSIMESGMYHPPAPPK